MRQRKSVERGPYIDRENDRGTDLKRRIMQNDGGKESTGRGGRTCRKQGTCIRNVATKKFFKRCPKKETHSKTAPRNIGRRRHSESDPDPDTQKTVGTEVRQEIHEEPKRGSKNESAPNCPDIACPSHHFLTVRDFFNAGVFFSVTLG